MHIPPQCFILLCILPQWNLYIISYHKALSYGWNNIPYSCINTWQVVYIFLCVEWRGHSYKLALQLWWQCLCPIKKLLPAGLTNKQQLQLHYEFHKKDPYSKIVLICDELTFCKHTFIQSYLLLSAVSLMYKSFLTLKYSALTEVL